MKYILSQTIFAGFVLALYFVWVYLRKRELKYRENQLFVFLCIFSAIWSFGFFGVILQTDPQLAYLWRAVGMVGTFGFLILAQYLVCYLSGWKSFYCRFAEVFSLLGIILFFFVIQKEQATYELSSIGMTYSFHPGIWNNLYISYTVIVAINMGVIIVYMIKQSKLQRLRELGKRLLIVEVVVLLGMLLDTVFPLFGKPAIPGSTMGQFWGLAAMYHSLAFVNHSRITISNMSEFIYYSLNVPVMVYDAKEKLQILNDKGFSFLGVPKEGMEETTIEKLFANNADEIFLFDGDSQSIDTICLNNGKDCNLAINKIHDDYGDVIGYILIVNDLSERIKSMKQLEEAMKEAEYANRAKSIFLANMSHEIRTPMNAIVGFSELLLKMDTSEEIRSHIQDIKWSSHNLLTIINDILDISKIESGKMELIPDQYYTAALLDDVIMVIQPQAEKKGLKFEIEAERNIPRRLYGDNVRIKGILVNILNNAVKYTEEGFIKFEVFSLCKQENKVKLAFRVTDSGVGIKEENLDTLFDNFERLDQRLHYGIEGSGLGLAIAKGYVTLMGGEIHVSSCYGEGSVFTVELEQEIIDNSPMEKEDIKTKEYLNSGKKGEFTIKNTRILVVDDNDINLKVAQGILRTYGLTVDTAVSGMKAVEMCKHCNYNIVFMDQMMPEMDGIQAMNQIRQINDFYGVSGEGKIVVLTANAIKGTREALMEQGFDEYLDKPIDMQQMERILFAFIAKENIIFSGQSDSKQTLQDEKLAFIKKNIPELDVDLGITHCGGGVEDYLRVLRITHKHGTKQCKELERLWKEKDYDTYHIKVHSLKSTSLNIGAVSVSQEAKRQEEAGIKGDIGYIEENIDKLLAEYEMILEKIEKVLKHYRLISSEIEEKPLLNQQLMTHMFRNIEKCIDEFAFAKVFDILEEAKKYRVPSEYEEILGQMEELMEDLSIDPIKEMLKEVWRKKHE